MRIDLNTLTQNPSTDEALLRTALRQVQVAESRAPETPKGRRPKKERSPEDREAHERNRNLSTPELLAKLKTELPAVWEIAEIVGQWVWLTFPSKPDEGVRDALYRMGFHWNHTRSAWQHPCGAYSLHSKGNPRFRYQGLSAREFTEEPQPGPEPGSEFKPTILVPATKWSPL